jgi:hypothetical protein
MKSPLLVLVLALCMPLPTEAFIADLFNIIISIFIPNWQVRTGRRGPDDARTSKIRHH